MRVAQEEIFGPTTALIRVRDFDEAIRVSNGIQYGLSSSVFTRDVNKAFRAMRDLERESRTSTPGRSAPKCISVRRHDRRPGRSPRGGPGRCSTSSPSGKSIDVDYSGKLLQKAQIDTES